MTYSVYSLNFSGLFPQQSEYLMIITAYFLLSIGWTLISMAWFVVCNHYTTKTEMPKALYNFCGLLQRMFFCCFKPPKQDGRTDKKTDIIIEHGKFKSVQKIKCILCQNIFASCLPKHNKVETIDEKQHTSVEDIETIRTNPTDIIEPAVFVSINGANENTKPKCNFCNKCESCQADFDKSEAKNKLKRDIEARCNALNYLVFICVLLLMFASNMTLWLFMSQ